MREHPNKLRSVFMGTPDFAARSLEELIKKGMAPDLVFSQPSRRSGRGMLSQAPPVVDLALAHEIPVEQPQKASSEEAVKVLKEVNPDIIIVVAYGELLKKEVLDIPAYGCINLHASLLPKYRGAAPIPWSIMMGETVTGVTTFFLDEGMDSGRMLLQEKIEIKSDDTSLSLTEKLADLGARVLVKSIQIIEKGDYKGIEQYNKEVTFAPKIRKEHGCINWNDTAEQIVRHVRAMFPWPGTFSIWRTKRDLLF
ncbi:MAG: methionyl-tRNA formyltransferase [Candidatus Theseobacter exili]|nr:methionyl-tRNA formyltransferase [Candidatus Theseobacter exili]